MNHYLPEEMLPRLPRRQTAEDLRRAARSGQILPATVLLCDEGHNLHVDIGGTPAVIHREDAALGIADGTARDIAILSRVGKQIACKVLPGEEGALRFTRAEAQQEALDHLLRTRRAGDIVPAVVSSLAPFGAFCDVGCGVTALLGMENISVARIRHPRDRFTPGQRIFCVLRQLDRASGRITLSHKELLGTWEENAERFRAGQTVPGIVRGLQSYGVFIELSPNLSGLCEPDPQLQLGDAVSVYIKAIQPDRLKVKLSLVERLPDPPKPRPLTYTKTSGHLDYWQYSPHAPRTLVLFEAGEPEAKPHSLST